MTTAIDVTPLYDSDGNDLIELMARGHVEPSAMAAAVNEGWGRHPGPFELADIEHVWRRAVPDASGNLACLYVSAEPGSRGAFRATIVDAWASRRRRAAGAAGEGEP